MLTVANDSRNGNHGQVRLAGGSGADRLGNRDDIGFTTGRGHLEGIEAGDLQVDGDLVLGRSNQSRLDGARGVALDGNPLLAERHDRQHDEQSGKDMFSHSEMNVDFTCCLKGQK